MAWEGESRRHKMAQMGIKTNIDDHRRFDMSNFVARGNDVVTIVDFKINSGKLRQTLYNNGWSEDEVDYLLYKELEIGNKRANNQFGTTIKDVVDYKINSGQLRESLEHAYWKNNEIDYLIYGDE